MRADINKRSIPNPNSLFGGHPRKSLGNKSENSSTTSPLYKVTSRVDYILRWFLVVVVL